MKTHSTDGCAKISLRLSSPNSPLVSGVRMRECIGKWILRKLKRQMQVGGLYPEGRQPFTDDTQYAFVDVDCAGHREEMIGI